MTKLHLVENDRTWIGGLHQTSIDVGMGDGMFQPMGVFWLESPGNVILGAQFCPNDEAEETLAICLNRAMSEPIVGEPRRPTRVRVATEELAEVVRSVLGDGVPVDVAPTPELDDVLAKVLDVLESEPYDEDLARDTYLRHDQTESPEVAGMFRSAAALYAAAPWRWVDVVQVLRVDIPDWGINGYCLSVMGKSGENLGWSLFESLDDFESIVEEGQGFVDGGPRESMPVSFLSLTFEAHDEVPDDAADEAVEQGWMMAGPDAYPRLDMVHDGIMAVPPDEDDLDVAAVLSSALATFCTRHRALFEGRTRQPACETIRVPGGPELTLCAPFLENDALDEYPRSTSPQEQAPRLALVRPGRNDPCHCGSGKKYKKCCLRADEEADRAGVPDPTVEPEPDPLAAKYEMELELLQWGNDRFHDHVMKAFKAFADEEESAQLAVPWLVYDVEIDGQTIADRYVKEHGRELGDDELSDLEAEAGAWLSIWEVEDVDPGVGMILRDVLSGEVRPVTEKSASQNLVQHDMLLARIVPSAGGFIINGVHDRPLPPSRGLAVAEKAHRHLRRKSLIPVERLRNQTFQPYLIRRWEDAVFDLLQESRVRPVMTTMDGEALEAVNDRFAIVSGGEEAVVEALLAHRGIEMSGFVDEEREHPPLASVVILESALEVQESRVGVSVFEPEARVLGHATVAEGELEVESLGRKRADGLRGVVEEVCGELIAFDRRQIVDLGGPDEIMQTLAPFLDGNEDASDDPERRAIEVDLQARHYADWPDRALPALGGRTPREAVTTPEGRRKVDVLLRDMQNMERRMRGERGFDFSGVRRALGLG